MSKFLLPKIILPVSIVFIASAGCNTNAPDKAAAYQPVFSADTLKTNTLLFGFPSFSYSETAEPFIRYLNDHLPGLHIKMKACTSFDEYLDYLNHNKFDLTLINGIQALEAVKGGYFIFGKVIDDNIYSGVVFTGKNTGIRKITDLKGKKLALGPWKTIPGTMMPLYYLYQHGLDVNKDIVQLKVSSFESAIIAVYVGKSEAGICLKRSWEVYVKNHPEVLSKVELKWESPPLINNALLLKKDVSDKIKSQLVSLIFSMQDTPDGKAALSKLEFSGFEKANNETYKPMMEFKARYDSVIHL